MARMKITTTSTVAAVLPLLELLHAFTFLIISPSNERLQSLKKVLFD